MKYRATMYLPGVTPEPGRELAVTDSLGNHVGTATILGPREGSELPEVEVELEMDALAPPSPRWSALSLGTAGEPPPTCCEGGA